MKLNFFYKISFVTLALLFIFTLSDNASAQRERIRADASQSARTPEDRVRESPRSRDNNAAETRLLRLRNLNRAIPIQPNNNTANPDEVILRTYEAFEDKLNEDTFRKQHVKLGLYELGVAYFLVNNNPQVKKLYEKAENEFLELFIERTKVGDNETIKEYYQILEKKGIDKRTAKSWVKSAERQANPLK